MAVALAGIWSFVGILHPWVVPEVAFVLTPLALSSALVATALALARARIPPARAHDALGALGFLLLANGLTHLALTGDPHETTNLMLVAVSAGTVLSSWRLTTLLAMGAVAGWFAVALFQGWSPLWTQFGFALLFAEIIGFVVLAVRLRVLGRLFTALHVNEEQREALERALVVNAQTEERYRRLVEHMPDGLVEVDGGHFSFANPAARRVLGDGLVGRPVGAVLPETASALSDLSRSVVHEQVVGPTREPLDVEVVVVQAPGAGQQQIVVRDVSERQRSERLKDELLSVLGHELRTPLTAISGGLDLLRSGAVDLATPIGAEIVAVAARNAERLRAAIDDVLQVQEIVAGRLRIRSTELNLADVVRAVALRAGPRVTAHVPEVAMVRGDGPRLGRLVSHLVANALKFAPADSPVDVDLQPSGGGWRLTVRDRGPGISAPDQARLFVPFSQLERGDARGVNGLGLGLTIARAVAHAHAGRLTVESSPGDTRFHVELPASC